MAKNIALVGGERQVNFLDPLSGNGIFSSQALGIVSDNILVGYGIEAGSG